MEFEDVREEREWEAKRVGAAFGVDEWTSCLQNGNGFELRSGWSCHSIWVALGMEPDGRWKLMCNGKTVLFHWPDSTDAYQCVDYQSYGELVARGLYLLGCSDEAAFKQLPPLSMHQKLELRFAMPREFWPQTWLDEGQTQESL